MDDTQNVSLAAWLRRTGHTQHWLSLQLGITTATSSRISRGIVMPRARTAERIVAITAKEPPGVTVAELVRAKAAHSPSNQAARRLRAKQLIDRAHALLEIRDNEVA